MTDSASSPPTAPAPQNQDGSMFGERWVQIAGVAFLAFAVLLLTGLAIAQVCGATVTCGPLKPLLILIVSLCTGAAGAFLGGWARATGAIPLPKVTSPMQISLGGGGALIVIMAIVLNYTFVCPDVGRWVRITDVEGAAKPGENLTVSYDVEGWPAGSSLALDYSTDKAFNDQDKIRTEHIKDISLKKLTFRIPPSISEGQGWLQLRVLDSQDNEIGKTKAPTPVKP